MGIQAVTKIQTFYDLTAWQRSHTLVLEVYKVTRRFPKEELFGITNQIRRAASSITANIAEGFARYHFKDKTRFYHQARGSVAEVQNFLTLARDLAILDQQSHKTLHEQADEARRLINGLIRSMPKDEK